PFDNSAGQIIQQVQDIMLPEIIIGNNVSEVNTTFNPFHWSTILFTIYLLGCSVFFIRLATEILKVRSFAQNRKYKKRYTNGYLFIETQGKLPTFSFFNLLFFDNTRSTNDNEKQQIIKHEEVHIKQHHSLDIILLEVVKALVWFNPITWKVKKQLADIHEFLADRKVVRDVDQKKYASLLARQALDQLDLSIGNYFNKSLTVRRIKMISMAKAKIKAWKVITILPIVATLIIIFSCQEVLEELHDNDLYVNELGVYKLEQTENIPTSVQNMLKADRKAYPEFEITYRETTMANKAKLYEFEEMRSNIIMSLHEFPDRARLGVILRSNEKKNASLENGIFTIVEQSATPTDGFAAFYQYIHNNLSFPEEAKKAGIGGKVYVQFIVEKYGEISDIKVVKGIDGYGFNEAAIDVLKNAPSWNAGIQDGQLVRQKIVLPISFEAK
ncbi:MAG: M56 family metallopeptidase, partial [Bacteroidota bacterium]